MTSLRIELPTQNSGFQRQSGSVCVSHSKHELASPVCQNNSPDIEFTVSGCFQKRIITKERPMRTGNQPPTNLVPSSRQRQVESQGSLRVHFGLDIENLRFLYELRDKSVQRLFLNFTQIYIRFEWKYKFLRALILTSSVNVRLFFVFVPSCRQCFRRLQLFSHRISKLLGTTARNTVNSIEKCLPRNKKKILDYCLFIDRFDRSKQLTRTRGYKYHETKTVQN